MTRNVLTLLTLIATSILTGCAASLHELTRQNDSTGIVYNISQGGYVDSQDEYGKTPLMVAAENGNTGIARLLIDKGANLNARSNYGDTPLTWSAYKGHVDTVKLLVERGADSNIASNEGNSPLLLASMGGHIQVVRFLIEQGNDVNRANNVGNTPLMLAARDKRVDVVKLLIEHGASINSRNQFGDTALVFAGSTGSLDCARILIEHNADLTPRNNDGSSALDLARNGGHTATVNLLAAAEQGAIKPVQAKPTPKLAEELDALIAKKDMQGLRIFLDAHPQMLTAIEDNKLRLTYTGPAELRIIDIAGMAKNKKSDALIIAKINSAGGPYINFDNDEMAALNNMSISDDVIAAMITITTTHEKEQKRLAEEQRKKAAALPVQQVAHVQQPVAEENTPIECLKLVAAIKACDQSSGFLSMGCKAVARSQFVCPIPVEELLR